MKKSTLVLQFESIRLMGEYFKDLKHYGFINDDCVLEKSGLRAIKKSGDVFLVRKINQKQKVGE